MLTVGKKDRGIYIIRSLISDKVYIGKFSRTDYNTRIGLHKSYLRNNKHHSKKLQNFVNKHGMDSLSFEVLKLVPRNLSEEKLNQLECDYIQKYNSYKKGFNMSLGGEGAVGAVRSMENRKKISDSLRSANIEYTKEFREKVAASSKNKKEVVVHGVRYPSARNAASSLGVNYNTMIGRLHRGASGYSYVEGTSNPESNKPHKISIAGVLYNSIGEASKAIGYTRSTIRARLDDERFPDYISLGRLNYYPQSKV